MIIYIIIIVCLLGIILLGARQIKNIGERNQNLLTELGKNSNTFRKKGIEEMELKKEIKDLEKENENLRRNK